MNVDQHLKVAQWHVEQARLHASTEHKCGCPLSTEHENAIKAVEEGLIKEESH